MTETSKQIRRKPSLVAFDSECGASNVASVIVGNKMVPARDVNALGRELIKPNPEEGMVDALSERVNQAVYGATKRIYGLSQENVSVSTESPQAFFQRHMQIAQRTQIFLATRVNPEDPFLKMPQKDFENPADIVKHLVAPEVESSSKEMLTGRLAIALLSAEQESYFRGTEKVRDEVDALFSTLVSGDKQPVYTVHNNTTNEIDRLETNLPTLFSEPINDDQHVKKHPFDDDYQQYGYMDGVGDVAIFSRIKSEQAALLKPIRDAILRPNKKDPSEKDLENGNRMDVSEVTDLIGSTVVVMNAEDSFVPEIETAKQKVKDGLKEKYGLMDDDFRDDNETNGRDDSRGFTFQRIQVKNIPGLQNEYEIFFFGKDYFNYKYKVGSIDPSTYEPTGPAHSLYQDLRFLQTYLLISNHIGSEQGQAIKEELVKRDFQALKDDKRVDIDSLRNENSEVKNVNSEEIAVFSFVSV